jgi:hypothetical protein
MIYHFPRSDFLYMNIYKQYVFIRCRNYPLGSALNLNKLPNAQQVFEITVTVLQLLLTNGWTAKYKGNINTGCKIIRTFYKIVLQKSERHIEMNLYLEHNVKKRFGVQNALCSWLGTHLEHSVKKRFGVQNALCSWLGTQQNLIIVRVLLRTF